MVVKTDLCHFTEYKIYPGRGMKYIAKDGKMSMFLNAKAASMFHQKLKAARMTWTQTWRRMNKKGKVEVSKNRKKGRAMKFQKAIVGMSLDDLRKKKAAKTEYRTKAKEEALKEAKDRKAKSGNKPKPAAGKDNKAFKNAPAKGPQKNFKK
jgi:large subunit ribosomal protein L24e